jgi:hypothetical protein
MRCALLVVGRAAVRGLRLLTKKNPLNDHSDARVMSCTTSLIGCVPVSSEFIGRMRPGPRDRVMVPGHQNQDQNSPLHAKRHIRHA